MMPNITKRSPGIYHDPDDQTDAEIIEELWDEIQHLKEKLRRLGYQNKKGLSIDYNAEKDQVTIEGVKFTGKYFRQFSKPDPDTWFRIYLDSEGRITVGQFTEGDILSMGVIVNRE